MSDKAVDMREYTTPGVGVFAGRERGKLVRAHAGIEDGDHVLITVPDDTICLTFSFVWELLRNCTAQVVNSAFHDENVQYELREQKRVEALGSWTGRFVRPEDAAPNAAPINQRPDGAEEQ